MLVICQGCGRGTEACWCPDEDDERTAMTGAELIAAERERQVADENYDEAHDDAHTDGSLALAAGAYALAAPGWWPWEAESFKLGDRRRELVKAGALIAAELDRLARVAPLNQNEGPTT